MENIDKLPLPVLLAMGVGLAVIMAVRYFGLMSGERTAPEKSASYAQVASVIVDPTALNRLTEQVTKLVEVLEDAVDQAKEKIRVDNLMAIELDRIREEMRIQREISRGR
ncbi:MULTISPECIES: hypothetical protein [unclassified Rhizobium]